MRASIWLGLPIALFLAGCETGPTDSDIGSHADGGPGEVDVILDGGGVPATPPDGVAACPAGICNYQSGQGCPQGSEACIPGLDGTGGVVPVCNAPGPTNGGKPCTQVTDCAAGFICAEKTCHKLCCNGDWTGCGSASQHCIKHLEYSGDNGPLDTGAMLCYEVNTCDALVPAGCPVQGTSCQIADATGATACLAEGTGSVGDPCPCKGGFTCVVGSGGPSCVRLCKAVEGGGAPYCLQGEGICTHFVRDPPGVGECSK